MPDYKEFIQPGMQKEEGFLIEERYSALKVGSGGFGVLATPSLVAFMESVAYRLLAEVLPAGKSSVGVHIDVRHLAATPVGKTVRVCIEVLEVNGPRVTFATSAWDEVEKVGEGRHTRVVVDGAKFLSRVQAKIAG